MASERSMRSRVTRALKPLDAVAIENLVQPGTPDVEFIGGWIELKSADAWPKGSNTALRVPHFTPLQRLWLRRRCRRGGKAWMLLRVGREWLLLGGDVASSIVGNSTKAELVSAAHSYWPKTPTDEELLAAFS